MDATTKGTSPTQHADVAHKNGNKHIPNSQVPVEKEPVPKRKSDQTQKGYIGAFLLRWLKAYGAALFMTGVMTPFITSVVTVILYFSPHILVLPFPFLPPTSSDWYAPLYGMFVTGIGWLIAALFACYFATAEGANMGSYALLRSRCYQLKAHLNLAEDDDEFPQVIDYAALHNEVGLEVSEAHSKIALREAYVFCSRVSKNLKGFHTGLRWVLGSGYLNTWEMLHRAEEALIEVEPIETVLRGAMHDMLSIQGSTMSNSDDLLDKLIQAVKDLDPLATEYFSEHQPDRIRDRLLNKLITTVNSEKTVLQQVAEKLDLGIKHADNSTDDDDDDDPGELSPVDKKLQAKARIAVREVRRALNDFRDSIWDGLVRARNRLLGTIVLTGFVTHVLLLIAILTDSAIGDKGSNELPIIAATAFYVVGAVAGLFGRFYNELSSSKGGDDYALSLARLIATPLLSGLAGVGGVLITALIYSKLVSTAPTLNLGDIFALRQTDYLLVAAIFGLTPNLVIKSLQQQAEKYVDDLRSSKGSDTRSVGGGS